MPVLNARIHLNRLAILCLSALVALSTLACAEEKFQDALRIQGGLRRANANAEFKFDLRSTEKPGEAVFTISVDIPDGHYIYSMTDPGPATRLDIQTLEGLEAVDKLPQPDHPPKVVVDPNLEQTVEKYTTHVTWTQKYRILSGARLSDVRIAGVVKYQICNDAGCRYPKAPFDLRLASAAPIDEREEHEEEEEQEPAAAQQSNAAPGAEAQDEAVEPDVGAQEPAAAPVPAAAPAPAAHVGGIDTSRGLLWFLGLAVTSGFAALLTPCVFPMIPITVSFFQKQSEKQHHRPVSMAAVYCLGIVATFTVLGLVMSIWFQPSTLNRVANSALLNLFIAGVLIFFGLNLLGMFEIRMPGWLLTLTANQEGRGGFIGVLFMALTFTLTSFTCTFAFVGLLLVAASQGERLWPALGLLAFSAAFALPFFFLARFPSFLQKLPRSGGWMNLVKVVMGLIEIGAAFKFFNTADLSWNGQAAIFDYHVVMSAWVITSIAAGLYLLGLFRLPHDTPVDHIGVLRFMGAMSFLGLASYLAVGLFSADKPEGRVWKYIAAFAAPQFHGGSDPTGPYLEHGKLKYALDFERAMEFAVKENKPLFLDFTGVNCTNCRYMEKGPMSQPDVEERLKRFVRVQLFTDTVPISDTAEAKRLYDFNLKLQESWFGDVTLPSYVVIPPDRHVLADRSKILEQLVGAQESEFVPFLDRGWSRWQQWLAGKTTAQMLGKR
ncbi:MAG: cytochrome c biogenesis protein CcdA [Planctomycetaceae bacterium]